MSLRTVSRSAIGGYVRLLRVPLDAAGGMRGDRLEGTIRIFLGRTLRDEELVRDGERRRLAADERDRAGRLRAEAQRRSELADERLSEREDQVEQRRRQATRRAAERKKQAEQQRRAKARRTADLESRRRRANEKAAERKEEAIEDRSKRARLQQLDEEADALAKQQDAVTARNESQRLRAAASKTKAARKRHGA